MSTTTKEQDVTKDPSKDPMWFMINAIMHTEAGKLDKVRQLPLPTHRTCHRKATNIYSNLDRLGRLQQENGHKDEGSRVSYLIQFAVFQADLAQHEAI
jgi:hypothetical protein